jgi:hypothetical protein
LASAIDKRRPTCLKNFDHWNSRRAKPGGKPGGATAHIVTVFRQRANRWNAKEIKELGEVPFFLRFKVLSPVAHRYGLPPLRGQQDKRAVLNAS